MTPLFERMALAPLPTLALLKRELLTTLRGQMPFFALVAVVAGVLLFTFGAFPQVQNVNSGAMFSSNLLDMISIGLAIAAFVFVSPVAALSIAGERERGTYEMLHLTLISPRALLAAKFLNAIAFFLLLCVALMPVVGVVFFFVGIEPAQFIRRFLAVLLFAIHCTNIGIMCSAGNHRGITAVMAGYFVLLTTVFFVLPAVAFSVIAGAVVVAFFGFMCYRVALGNVAAFLPIPAVEEETSQRVEVILPDQKPVPYTIAYGPARAPCPDSANPMMWREMQWGVGGRGPRLKGLLWGSLAVNLFFTLISIENEFVMNRTIISLMAGNMVIMLLALPMLSAGAVTREVELGNLDLLRTTMMTAREILDGKMLAAAIAALPLLGGPLAATCLAAGVAFYKGDFLLPFLAGFATMALYTALAVVGGVCISTFARRTTQSVLFTYALLGFTTAGLPILLMPFFLQNAAIASPGAAFLNWLDHIRTKDAHTMTAEFGIWLASAALYAAAVWGMYAMAHRQFAGNRMRDI